MRLNRFPIGQHLQSGNQSGFFSDRLKKTLLEASDSRRFVVEYLKNSIKLGDLEQIVNSLSKVQQLKFSALISDGGKTRHEFANSGAVNVRNVREIQQNLFLAFHDHLAQVLAKHAGTLSQCNSAHGVNYDYVTHLAGRQINTHG
jgi:nitrate reductase beta subunit